MKSICLTLVTAVFLLCGEALAADKPNIIFVMADDLGWGDVGFNGNQIVKTPHLEVIRLMLPSGKVIPPHKAHRGRMAPKDLVAPPTGEEQSDVRSQPFTQPTSSSWPEKPVLSRRSGFTSACCTRIQ